VCDRNDASIAASTSKPRGAHRTNLGLYGTPVPSLLSGLAPECCRIFTKNPLRRRFRHTNIWCHRILPCGTSIPQNAYIDWRCFKHLWRPLLFNPPQNHEKGQATTARRAAEALFVPKKEPSARAPEGAVAHKPRILAVQPSARSEAANTPVSTTRRAIPKSQVDRIRTWLRYGMTARQAAGACGVSVSELKEALR
jgi:hypothetical protein